MILEYNLHTAAETSEKMVKAEPLLKGVWNYQFVLLQKPKFSSRCNNLETFCFYQNEIISHILCKQFARVRLYSILLNLVLYFIGHTNPKALKLKHSHKKEK